MRGKEGGREGGRKGGKRREGGRERWREREGGREGVRSFIVGSTCHLSSQHTFSSCPIFLYSVAASLNLPW